MDLKKLETTNVFDDVLFSINVDLHELLQHGKISNVISGYPYEVTKFYLSLFVLRALDNIAVTRIWVKDFQRRIRYYFHMLLDNKTEEDQIKIVTDIFRLLEKDNYYELLKITVEGTIAYGLNVMEYLDVASEVQNSDAARYHYLKLVNTTLRKGYVIIPLNDIDFLSSFVEYFAQLKIFKMYEGINTELLDISKKIKLVVATLKEYIKNSNASINIKKYFIPKELLYEQERVKEAEQANIIIKDLENNRINISSFPPCLNVLLDKIYNKKIQLTHNENLLLVSYLNKKNFPLEYIIKIFSNAINYNKKVTDYQVEFAVKKGTLPMNCVNLQTEGLCKMDLDKTKQCGYIKSPLSFR